MNDEQANKLIAGLFAAILAIILGLACGLEDDEIAAITINTMINVMSDDD